MDAPAQRITKDPSKFAAIPANPLKNIPLVNLAFHAVDAHLGTSTEGKTALLWEGDNGATASFTFGDMARLSNQHANYLTSLGVTKGDRVFLFLPRIPVLYAAFLGILKTGAIAGTLFSAFQEQALVDRLQ